MFRITKSIKSRILLWLSLLLVLIISIIVLYSYTNIYNNAYEQSTRIVELEVKREKVYVEKELSLLYESTYLLVSIIEEIRNSDDIVNKRDVVLSITETFLIDHDNIAGVNIVFEPNAFDNDDDSFIGDDKYSATGQFIPYMSFNYGTINIEPVVGFETLDMYVLTKALGESLFTEPYHYEIQGTDTIISTVSIPVFNELHEFIGVVGIDFEVSYLYDYIAQNFNPTFERRDFIVTSLGVIIVNSDDSNDVMEHISGYHPNCESGFEMIDTLGIIEGTMPSGNFEVGLQIALGETGEHWYMLSDVDSALLVNEANRISNTMIFLGVIAVITMYIVMYLVLNSILTPLHTLTSVIGEFDPNNLENFEIEVESKELVEIEILVDKYQTNLHKMQEDSISKNNINLIQNAQIDLRNVIQKSNSLDELSDSLLLEITSKVEAEIGALYINKSLQDKGNFLLHGRYGLSKTTKLEYAYNEGLIGQTAIEREIKVYNDIDIAELSIDFGVGIVMPKNIAIIPCVVNKTVVGIIEIGKLSDYSTNDLEYLETISFSIASALEKVMANDKTKELLDETQKLTKLLEEQQEELRVSNEELETQQEELRVSNEELESQQEELRVVNEELETNIIQINEFNKNLQIAQTKLEMSNIEIAQASRYKSEFLANMSHELRTPLNSILILSELLSENKKISDKNREFAKTINSSGKDLLNLINGILDLSKVESGKEDIVITSWNIKSTIESIKKIFEPIATKSKLDFIVNYDEVIENIETDEKKVKQIITNLLSNAFKFTKKGSVTLDIFLKNKDLFLKVTDTGIGILPGNLESIFGAFQQGDGTISRKFGGTGLGLSISNHYSRLLGGRLIVESEPLKGSVFTLVLPTSNEKTKMRKASKSKSKASLKSRESDYSPIEDKNWFVSDDRHNIEPKDLIFLVIDDDSSFASSLVELIRDKGHKVIVTETGENGLFLADYYLPSGIILDISLPKMNGYKVIEHLKLNQRTKEIPVYLVSGKNIEGSNRKGLTNFFEKPISTKQIDEIILSSRNRFNTNARLLVIEDNINQRNSIIRYINESSIDFNLVIDSAGNGKETLELLKLNRYDLIVLDLGLKDVKDFELLEKIKKDKRTSNPAIIIYTGKSFSQKDEEYLEKMVEDIIIKGEKAHKRLVEDIKLFIHGHKNKIINDNSNEFKDKTILLIDDDMRNIFSVSGVLDTLNINVVFDTNAPSGINRLEKDSSIDLVLMDIMMPEMDGYEAMEIIRKNKKFSKLPIIALTAKTMRGDRQKCITAGATEYLSKPLDKDKLISVLRVWL